MRRRHADRVLGVRFEGAEAARPAPGVLDAIAEADVVFIAPSNPFVSIEPILAVPGIEEAVRAKRVAAVSPIVGGKALRGPLAEMLAASATSRAPRGRAPLRRPRLHVRARPGGRGARGRDPRSRRLRHGYGFPRAAGRGRPRRAGGDRMIGIVGGTGDFGQGLAERLRRLGEEVVLGSRTPHDEFVSNGDCAEDADIVFLSVPPERARRDVRQPRREPRRQDRRQRRKPGRLRDGKPGAEPVSSPSRSSARRPRPARDRGRLPHGQREGAGQVDEPLDEDVLLCGDDEEAKAVVGALAERIVAGRAVDAGRLEVARWLEPVTAVLLNVNRRYKASSGVRVTGLP